ncbi:MAG TPA: hypothetical protein QGF75_02095 [Candidatus Marinimicrobia bacterium]|nr:hypothetical protein [Candidatus Neomarinimicrobiota bacterium]
MVKIYMFFIFFPFISVKELKHFLNNYFLFSISHFVYSSILSLYSDMNIILENIIIAIIGAMLIGLILIVVRDMIKALFNIKNEGN